jgi:aminoglycoside 6'-N-acetyltransferase
MRPRDDERRITFRSLTDADIDEMARWLADPDVYAWYREGEPTVENLTRIYRPIIDGTDPIRGWIVQVSGTDAGFVQCSEIASDSEYAAQLDLPDPFHDGAVGIDLLLGEPRFRDGGWGPVVLRSFLGRIVFGELRSPAAVIAPELMNERAIHAYERAGFRYLKTVPIVDEDPDNTEDEYVTIVTDEYVMGVTAEEFRTAFG